MGDDSPNEVGAIVSEEGTTNKAGGRGRVVTKKKKETFADVVKEHGFKSVEEFNKAVNRLEQSLDRTKLDELKRSEGARQDRELDLQGIKDLFRKFPELDKRKKDTSGDEQYQTHVWQEGES